MWCRDILRKAAHSFTSPMWSPPCWQAIADSTRWARPWWCSPPDLGCFFFWPARREPPRLSLAPRSRRRQEGAGAARARQGEGADSLADRSGDCLADRLADDGTGLAHPRQSRLVRQDRRVQHNRRVRQDRLVRQGRRILHRCRQGRLQRWPDWHLREPRHPHPTPRAMT